jgi:hypothetical protein
MKQNKNVSNSPIFNTNKRIRLGIWGLGRGMSFYKTCQALNIDVVAGCDYNEHMRKRFLECNPGAFATNDCEKFLASDIDAVLLATFCHRHAPDALLCLQAGKHVLSEVISFFSLAEGVKLVEEVEKRKLVYNLAENYPFSPANRFLARKWKEGLFGELMYGEYEYVHEVFSLAYTYIDGVPVQPGNTVHAWRSWMDFHYYCTHSLGPIMVITDTRPTHVVSLPSDVRLPGYIVQKQPGMGRIAPSLIRMNNGGLVKNLMGSTTNDSHHQRLWGTLGSCEIGDTGLLLRLGGAGYAMKMPVTPDMTELDKRAASTGHGGGDFWVLYYFARQILTGEPAPFDIYAASDVTIPGILALRSAMEGGKAYEVPDFRKKADRDKVRDDDWRQEPYDVKKVFPLSSDYEITRHFTRTMADMHKYVVLYRQYIDWKKVIWQAQDPQKIILTGEKVVKEFPDILATYKMARKIADAYPASDGARVLREILERGCEKEITARGALEKIKKELGSLKKKYKATAAKGTYNLIAMAEASQLLPMPAGGIEKVGMPGAKIKFSKASLLKEDKSFIDIRPFHKGKDGMVYVKACVGCVNPYSGKLYYHADGPFKIWFNGKLLGVYPEEGNPGVLNKYVKSVSFKKGANEIVLAISSNKGKAWCTMLATEM